MKNFSFTKVVLFIAAMFLNVHTVMATTPDDYTVNQKVANKTAVLVCDYKDSDGNTRNKIYYWFEDPTQTVNLGPWDYYYTQYNLLGHPYISILKSSVTQEHLSIGNFRYVFSGPNSRVSYNQDKNKMTDSFEANFKCPKNAFSDLDWLHEVCYADYETCGTNFENGPYKLDESANSIFKIIDDYAADAIADPSNVTAFRNGLNITEGIRSKVRTYIKTTYQFETKYKYPDFIKNYIDHLAFDISNIRVQANLEELRQSAREQVQQEVATGQLTQEEAEEELEEIEQTQLEAIVNIVSRVSANLNMRDDPNCQGLLGTDMSRIVNNLFTFVQYLGPVLVVVFSIIDFVKAAVSGDDGQMKKAGDKLMKRIVCGILLFFVPLICSILLDFGGITLTDMCITRYGS